MNEEELYLHEKYIKAIENNHDWLTVSEWALQVAERYPEILAKAENDAVNQKNKTTGLREIAARISSRLSANGFESLDVDTSEKPKKVRYIRPEEKTEHLEQDLEEDIAPLKRNELIKLHTESLTIQDLYRIDEMEVISKQIKTYFSLDFEVDHAQALLNPQTPGKHHPDNLQLLLKAHNGKKHSKNWERFSFDEQAEYITTAIKLQEIVAQRLGVQLESSVITSLIQRLKAIY